VCAAHYPLVLHTVRWFKPRRLRVPPNTVAL
jgi:hypothetical protein